MKQTILLLIISIALSACSTKKPDSIQLVSNGKSKYIISIPLNASPEEERAAIFLQEHVRKISGCELPVVPTDEQVSKPAIYISKSNEILDGDGFKLFTNGNNLFIEGGQGRGCIYGVSELLEQYLDVKYYSPHFVVIPEKKDIMIPAMQISGASPNTYRNVNGDFVKDPNYKDFHRLHDISDMFADGYFVHTFHRLVPWQEHFKSNPEYFAFMNGKRIIDQLCLTNEQVFQLVLNKLEQEMLLQPKKQVWSVSQDDNFSHCQCKNCMKIIEEEKSASGPIIRFVNRVAEQFPDKIISTLAYQYSRQAPVRTKPAENVQIMLCTIELNRSQPIADDPRSTSFLTDLEDWGKISNHIFLWDYTVNFAHHISPFPNLHTLQPNIQLFAGNNVKEHFQQSNTGVGHEFSELKSWLLAKLLWNPDADVPALINEFTDGFYGPAGIWVRKYMEHLQDEILKTGEWLDIYGPPNNHQHTFLSESNIDQYNHYFDEAEKSVDGMPDFLLHLRTTRMALQYAIMEIGKADMFGPRGWYKEADRDFVLEPNMAATLESFYQTGIQSNAAFVNESGLTVEQYYQATKRFIDVQVKGNLAFRKNVTANPAPAAKYSGGELALLTNGVRGANDFKVHWLGWEAKDFSLVLDLEEIVEAETIEISTLYDPKSWILHPASVTCLVSSDGINYRTIEKQTVAGDQRKEEVNRLFSFQVQNIKFRFVKIGIKGTLQLFDWHPSAGGGSWVFVDEIVVR
jgi:hypothetical protein